MEIRDKKTIKEVLAILFKLFIFVTYIVAFAKFFNVDDMCEKIEYGLSVIVLTILFFSRE